MGTAGQSITLANSIIGVGILAMPFCFQQCGVVLATVILLFMGLISRLCCYFLLKSALIARRRNFEFLAFHVFGPAGKLAVEIGIIGFLMGTCIAYFVVVGDLGPQIIAKMLNINQSDILRTSIMVVVSLVCVLPLGLLRNVDSLSNVSAATIGFYFCLVIKVIAEAATQLFSSEWHSRVEMWKPSGILQCVPIFSMALFCQTQLFEIFESLPTLSLEKMNVVTKNAINICTAVYFTLGLFGYIAFSSHTISGNILMSLSPTMASDVIKLGFVMSVAFSFPLIIFPCRASLYSALYRRAHPAHHDHIINHSIPEATFRCITVAIIAVALFISLLLPNIELVLGLVGSTIGVLVCVLFPAACFVNITYKNTNERILAKGVLILGLVILVLGTYANLQAAESSHDRYDDSITPERIDKIVEDFFEKMEKQDKPYKQQQPKIIKDEILKKEIEKDSVIQPPNPLPPVSNEKHLGDEQKNKENKVTPPPTEKLVPVAANLLDKMPESHPKNIKTKLNGIQGSNSEPVLEQILDKPKQENAKPQLNQVKDKTDEKDDLIKQKELIETIKQHREEQKELIEEQKEILDKLIQTKKELQKNKKEENAEEDAKKVAVESIQKIANMAIKSLTGVSEKPDEDQKDGKKNEPNTANEVVQEIAEKAVKAIVEIAEQKPTKQDKNNMAKPGIANIENAPNDNINSVPVLNNDQANIILQPNAPNNILRPSVSNFAPINPPKLLPAESLVQNQNLPETVAKNKNVPENPNNSPIGNPQPIGNDAQVNSNLPPDQQLPLINQNIPAQSAQIQQQNQKPSQVVQQQDGLNFQQQNQLDQQQNQLNVKQHQLNQQQNQLNQQQIQLDQQQNQLVQQQTQVKQQKREVEEQNIQKDQIIDNNQSAQQIQKDQNTNPKKAHSHSPDEPQSYKQGEDTQQNAQIKDNVAQNVPIPIATNNNVQESDIKAMNVVNNGNRLPVDVKNTQNGLNKIETIQNDNGAKNNPDNLENNAVPRQKREVIDCTKTLSLQPEDKEICKVIADNKVESDNKITTISEELLPPNVDLAKIGLNSIPIELIHHGRSLKSIDKMEKKR